MVQTILGKDGLLGVLGSSLVTVLDSVLGFRSKSSLLLLLGFRLVLVEQLEQLGSGVLVQSVGELGNCGRDLESLVENDLLSLKSDVCGPFDESGQVSLGGDVSA